MGSPEASAPPAAEDRQDALSASQRTAVTAPPSYRRTLANRPFFLLWLAQLVSQSGDFIFEVALLWLVLEITGSAFEVGLVVAATILPTVVLGPLLGVYIDRWDHRRTLLGTNLVQGVVVASLSGLVVAGDATMPGLLALVVMLASGSTVVRTTTSAYVPSVVGVSDLPPANGLLSLSGSMNQIVGLSLGGIFVAVFGVVLPIEYDAVTFFAAAALLLAIPRRVPTAPDPAEPSSRQFRRELAEGFAYIRSHRFMVEVLVLGLIVNFFANGVFALLAPFSRYVLHGGAAVYGFLGAFVAAGSLVGATAVGRVDTRESAGRYLFGGGMSIGAAILFLGFATSLPIALGLMAVLGTSIAVTNLPIQVLLQAKVPRRLLGRVSATLVAMIVAAGPLGPIFAGWLAQRSSIETVFLLSGGVFFAVVAVGALTMSSLRNVRY